MKYLYDYITFAEVPNETSLAVSITGCQIHCEGCHSRELWEDKGTPLTIEELQRLLEKHQDITCLCLLGGEADIDALTELFQYAHKRIKTSWYCGLDFIPKEKTGIIEYLDFLKIGHYDYELGGLASPTTNQRFFQIEHFPNGEYMRVDITNKFYTKNKKNED
jgi:anaerobic ribonucleoside-triphosphate reductase activating protein